MRRGALPQLLDLPVDDLGSEGRGVARDAAGKAVFVHGALPRERVDVQLVRRHRRYDEGDAVAVRDASPQRVAPRCAVYGTCGGCALQHMAPEAQLAFKEGQLLQALRRLGRVAPGQLLPPLAGPVWHYRRRARLGVKWVAARERVLVGFRERHKYYITDMAACEVLVEPAAALLGPLAELVGELSLRERLPQIEVAAGDDALGLVLRVLAEPTADLQALERFARAHDVRLYLQPGGPHTVRALLPEYGPLHYALPAFDVRLAFLPTDFVQVNGAMNAAMVSRVVQWLAPEPGMQVLDLFCGLGNFSLPLARAGARVLGVELEKELVARARDNARSNGLSEAARFVAADLFEAGAVTLRAGERADALLLDPPRAGAETLCREMARLAPQRIVYVSCHPATLARDAGILVHEQGYRLQAAGVMDMFPHTAHVEAMAVFSR